MHNAYSDWISDTDEQLLKRRICDLKLTIEGSPLEEPIQILREELQEKGLPHFQPQVYLGDEWFSPSGMAAIAIPFYLAHPRLKELEKNQMLDVEGGTPEQCLKLLRHEAGHCFDHAFGFSKKRQWREVFGSPNIEYDPDNYKPKPYSKSFVRHLDNWYAQAHPDEDFAETFAVWLSPQIDWKRQYSGWKHALLKLEYIDKIAKSVSKKIPKQDLDPLPYAASRMRSTLESYYAKRKREHAQDYPDFYDADLRRIFNGDKNLKGGQLSAVQFLTSHRREIIDAVGFWTGSRKFTINSLVRKLATRCEVLGLFLGRSEAQTNLEVAAYLATLVTNYLFTGKFKRSV